jgi:uncharacterized membrane protein (DUF4010 family)
MLKEIQQLIPPGTIKFILVAVFSLLIGLEQRRHHIKEAVESLFGTDRTFTLIGIFGYILYVISPQNLWPFLGGGAAVATLLAIFYFQKIKVQKMFGITSLVIAMITYCLAPLVYTQPLWLVLLIVVIVLVITEMKATFLEFSKKFDNDEFITLAKFLVIAGVILPLLPDKPISADINISPYKCWLAVVAVSGISYLSYLLKKFVFPDSGILLTGLLGGLYSSTATTIILARKSKEMPDSGPKVSAAIILATAMMYIRIFLLAFFFDEHIAFMLAPYLATFTLLSLLIAGFFMKFKAAGDVQQEAKSGSIHSNPLEFKTALLFAGLFILFGLVTGYVLDHYGAGGMNILSFVVGVTDIDPFILNLLQGKWNISDTYIVMAVLNAVSSNNLLKMCYAIIPGDRSLRRNLIIGFSVLIIAGLVSSLVLVPLF